MLALDKHTTGDGIVSALLTLQAACRTGKSIAQMLDQVTLFPQTLINVRVKPGSDWKTNADLAKVQAVAVRELGADGRVLIRASGTEPLVRVMVEARDAAVAHRYAQRMADTLA